MPRYPKAVYEEGKNYVPTGTPHIHRRNTAEKAISTFKDHLIAGLASVSPKMPMHLWCRLLPQALLTLNLLRQSRINSKLSSYAQLNGQHDYNANPLSPPGIQVLIHEKSTTRKSWAPHGVEGWYLGPTMEHYRCYRVISSKTGGERITDTVQFFPHDVPLTGSTPVDRAIEAATELPEVISNFKYASPLKDVPDEKLAGLHKLADIFQESANKINKTGGATDAHTNKSDIDNPTSKENSPSGN